MKNSMSKRIKFFYAIGPEIVHYSKGLGHSISFDPKLTTFQYGPLSRSSCVLLVLTWSRSMSIWWRWWAKPSKKVPVDKAVGCGTQPDLDQWGRCVIAKTSATTVQESVVTAGSQGQRSRFGWCCLFSSRGWTNKGRLMGKWLFLCNAGHSGLTVEIGDQKRSWLRRKPTKRQWLYCSMSNYPSWKPGCLSRVKNVASGIARLGKNKRFELNRYTKLTAS